MDDQYDSNKPSPRRELQGPRPTPLKVRKDSHKIIKNKPPLVPQQQQHLSQLPHHEVPQHRLPVIIYTVSPKVIHTQVSDFMSTVQRLTGFSSSSSYSSSCSNTASSSVSSSSHVIDCVSPAARFATIDKANTIIHHNSSSDGDQRARLLMGATTSSSGTAATGVIEEMELELQEKTAGSFPAGILSPLPSALPPISPNFFSSSPLHVTDPNSLGFLNYDINFSPIFPGNRNYIEGTMVPSPSVAFLNSSTTTPITSPTLSYDLFNHFLDL